MQRLNARQLTYERSCEEVSWRPVAAASRISMAQTNSFSRAARRPRAKPGFHLRAGSPGNPRESRRDQHLAVALLDQGIAPDFMNRTHGGLDLIKAACILRLHPEPTL
jgi:hypothetical protein